MGIYETAAIERMAEDVLRLLHKSEPDFTFPPNEEWITLDKFHSQLQNLKRTILSDILKKKLCYW